MPVIPTLYGVPVEHSEADVRDAEARMRSCLGRVSGPAPRKAQQALQTIAALWGGLDGTKSMRGVRVPPEPESVRIVAALVHHPASDVRVRALSALQYTRMLASCAVDEIVYALADEHDMVRLAAARLLSCMTPEGDGTWVSADTPIVDALCKLLSDPLYSVRWAAVRALALANAATPAELSAVLLASEPTHGPFLEDWAGAAEAIRPMPPSLRSRLDRVRALTLNAAK